MSPAAPSDLRALVAVDLGAESCRVSLLRWVEGKPHTELVHRFPNGARTHAGGLRWDLDFICAGVDHGLRLCAERATEGIRSLAVDGWAVDYVRLSPEGKALADPFSYRDERTLASFTSLHTRIPAARMREIAGIQQTRLNTAYQLFADTENPEAAWLNLPEYLLHTLGGHPVSERTNASHTELMDFRTGQWSPEIFAAASLSLAAAPRLVAPGTAVGKVTGPLAALPAFRDTTLIAPACHDTASAIAGIPASGDDWAYLSAGTWSLVGTLLPAACNSPEAQAEGFTNLSAAGGQTLFHQNVNGMWLLRQSMDHWAAEQHRWEIDDLVRAAESEPTPIHLLHVDVPDLLLPGNMPARINRALAAQGKPTLDEHPAHAPAFANLIFHSLAYRYGEVLTRISQLTGKQFRRLFVVGGASQNLYMNRLMAANLALEVHRGPLESATIGNFAVQLATLEYPGTDGAAREHIQNWTHALAGSL